MSQTNLELFQQKKYGKITFDSYDKKWVISNVEPHVSIRLKQIFPKIAKHDTAPFDFPDNPDVCADLYWVYQRYPMDISNSDLFLLEKNQNAFFQNQTDREKILTPNWSPQKHAGLKEGQELRHYQWQFVNLFQEVKQLLLGDGMGLGKTYEGLGACLIPGALPAAIVVQPHLQIQWAKKCEEFCNLRCHIVKSRKAYNLPDADIYIFKYTQLDGWVEMFEQSFFNLACFDEIQELRHGISTNKGASAKKLCQNTRYQLGLSGTPIYGYGIEIFNIYDHFIKPGFLGSRDEFIREWCSGYSEKIVNDPSALGTYLRENHLLLRRTKQDVRDEVEPVNTIIEKVNHDDKLVKDSEDLAISLAMTTLNGSFTESGQAAREFDMRLREATGIGKAKNVAAYARLVIESGEPVILAGWHREVYEIWLEELKDLNPLMHTGSETPSQKEKNKEDFINGKSDLLIISLRSGAGVDGFQHRCSTILIGELDWSPKVHEQLIQRIDREGQKNPVMAIYLTTNYGSDPAIIEVLGLKDSQSKGILDPLAGPQKKHSDRSRIKIMAESFLKNSGKN